MNDEIITRFPDGTLQCLIDKIGVKIRVSLTPQIQSGHWNPPYGKVSG